MPVQGVIRSDSGQDNMHKRRVITIFAVIFFLFIAVIGYRSGFFSYPGAGPSITVVPDLANSPVYKEYRFGQDASIVDIGIQPLWLPGIITEVMRRDRILAQALNGLGLEARFHPFLKGADVNYFLARGDLEAGIGGDMPAIMACVQSKVVVTTRVDHSFSSIVARTPMLVRGLRGKTVAYGRNSNAYRMLMELLAADGLDESNVRLVALEVNEMPDALASGTIDAFAAWEPAPTIALNRDPAFAVIGRGTTTGYLYFSETFARVNREAVQQIVAAQMRAINWLRLDHDNLLLASQWALVAGAEFTGEPMQITGEQLASVFEESFFNLTDSTGILSPRFLGPTGQLARKFQFLKGRGLISEATTWDTVAHCFDTTVGDEILSAEQPFRLDSFDLENTIQ